MDFVSHFIKANNIKTVVDIGCGDWQFSRHIDWSGVNYRGFDVVQSVVDRNQSEFGSDNVSFSKLDSIDQIPECDLIVCKDVLQHLPLQDIFDLISSFRAKSKYSLLTNDISGDTTPDIADEKIIEMTEANCNYEIQSGEARSIRLDREPFLLKAPTVLRFVINWNDTRWIKDTCLMIS